MPCLNNTHEVVHILVRRSIAIGFDILKVFPRVGNAFEIFIVRNVDEIEVADNSVFHILELTPLHSRTGVTAVCVLLTSYHVIDTDTGLATTFTVFQTKVVMSVYSQLGSAVATFQHRLGDDR